MFDPSKRKCAKCKGIISIIDRNNINKILKFQRKYYHIDCFKEIATQKASSKKGKSKPEVWQYALDTIEDLEAETREEIKQYWDRCDLNAYLLSQYDIKVIPKTFWEKIADLQRGIYKGNQCKPITMETILSAWKWGQKNLDKIDASNKAKHKGPKNDGERIIYDFAVLIQHIPQFFEWQKKQKAAEAEREINRKEDIKVDYNKIKTVSYNDGLDDISDLLDDLI